MPHSFGELDLSKKFTAKTRSFLDNIPEIHEVSTESDWFENPGGIPGNVLSKLPKFLKIEASSLPEEINDKTGSMQVLLNNLFEDVKEPHLRAYMLGYLEMITVISTSLAHVSKDPKNYAKIKFV